MSTQRINGSLALQPEHIPEQKPAVRRRKVVKQKVSPEAKRMQKAVVVFYMIIIFALAFFLIGREVQISEKSNRVNTLNRALDEAVSANTQAMLAVERSLDLSNIEQVAAAQLGLARPEKHQTIYINVRNQDYVEKVADKGAGERAKEAISTGVRNFFGIFASK